jgi:DNA modification methylase
MLNVTNSIEKIIHLDQQLTHYFQGLLILQPDLTRSLVSFQGNKGRPVYRWYKYKEAFSAALVEYLLQKYAICQGTLLDPFAGSGTALFTASNLGINTEGIELLPVGQEIIKAKKILQAEFSSADFARLLFFAKSQMWEVCDQKISLLELRITQGAYPQATQEAIEKYLGACEKENSQVKNVLYFALLSVLESISYTRKDGQYLRWDYRSGRGQGKQQFDKGEILDFPQAIQSKIAEIINDLNPSSQQIELFTPVNNQGSIQVYLGSSLEIMTNLLSHQYDIIITSPPYCNRYDYTRTYALELALLGVNQEQLLKLRQGMLSCTVENRPKDLLNINSAWSRAIKITDDQNLLQSILSYLEEQKKEKLLNNSGIPRMVKGYFYEMACIIQESFRVLKSGAYLIMVNDNVRYAGVSISVDMILSAIAEKLGFIIENILVLPSDKGNSSQQMGNHGRESLRKCIYIWKKP